MEKKKQTFFFLVQKNKEEKTRRLYRPITESSEHQCFRFNQVSIVTL
jgi:hypothetical protein